LSLSFRKVEYFADVIERLALLRSALFWDSTLRKIPEERGSHLHLGGRLKSFRARAFAHR